MAGNIISVGRPLRERLSDLVVAGYQLFFILTFLLLLEYLDPPRIQILNVVHSALAFIAHIEQHSVLAVVGRVSDIV